MEGQELKDLLMQAAGEAVPKVKTKEEIYREEQVEKAIDIVEAGKDGWNVISSKMEGEFAERFLREMENLSGREFVRTYMKMLEYFKPKIVRVEGAQQEEEEKIIRIEIFNSAPKLEEKTIDIEHKEE